MNDYQDETSKYSASLTEFIPTFGRALLLAAVDFTSTSWITEHYVLPPTGARIKGTSIHTSVDPVSTPKELIPTPDQALKQGMETARAAFFTTIFNHDRTLCRDVVPIAKVIRPPIEPKELALLHLLNGEFTAGLQEVHDNTQCEALKQFLNEILRYQPFTTK